MSPSSRSATRRRGSQPGDRSSILVILLIVAGAVAVGVVGFLAMGPTGPLPAAIVSPSPSAELRMNCIQAVQLYCKADFCTSAGCVSVTPPPTP